MTTKEKLKIGIVAPPAMKIVKDMDGYGGTERVISKLVEGLVDKGHEVTLFAPEGSESSAKLVTTGKGHWGKDYETTKEESEAAIKRTLDNVYGNLSKLDIVNFHLSAAARDSRFDGAKIVTTEHGDTSMNVIKDVYEKYPGTPVIFISKSQSRNLPDANKIAVVYNGVDTKKFTASYKPGDYLVFLGRVSEEKGMHAAIEVANQAKMQLVAIYRLPIVNKSDKVANMDWDYYRAEIEPRFKLYGDSITHVVNPPREVRDKYLREALALVAPSGFPPSKWSEPFGMQVIESMASGTPAIVYRRGGTTETVSNGKTGYVCDTVDDMVKAVGKVKLRGEEMRLASRERAERMFSMEKMAQGYDRAYHKYLSLLRKKKPETVGSFSD